jgi:hypothetical protein
MVSVGNKELTSKSLNVIRQMWQQPSYITDSSDGLPLSPLLNLSFCLLNQYPALAVTGSSPLARSLRLN